MPSMEWVEDLGAEAALAVAERLHGDLVAAEAAQFYLAAHWVDLHPGEAVEARRRSGAPVLPGMERAVRSGADGTPGVAEFAAVELGAVLGMGQVAAGHFVRDAVNVRHRHPQVWAAIAAGRGRVWQARRIAQACASAGLDATQARWVDAAVAPYLGSLPWGRLESLVEAKIVEADPDAAEARARAAAMARFVRTGQSSEYGLKTLVARANAGDVVFFVAMVDRIAQILHERGDTDPVDVRRSKAVGVLAVPARALALLEWGARHAEDADPNSDPESAAPDLEDGPADAGDPVDADDAGSAEGNVEHGARLTGRFDIAGDPDVVTEADMHPSQNDADDPAPEPASGPVPCGACHGAGQVPAEPAGDPTAFTRPNGPPRLHVPSVDPRSLLPQATLYLHLSENALRARRGVAWMEGVGPVTLGQVVEFLGHTQVRVVPVRDLADSRTTDGYRPPEWMAETLHLRQPACVSPWSGNLSRRKDLDHVVPYVPPHAGGPPGQTRLDNLAPLARFAHRLKTHGRWRLRRISLGVYEWRSPHGYRYHVDAHGTWPLGKDTSARDQPGSSTRSTVPGWSRPGSRPGPRISRVTSTRRVAKGWMETYETDVAFEVADGFSGG